MNGLPEPGDERGTTLVELLVGMAMGMIVLAGLSMVIVSTLHGNARVDARVEATQNARITMTKIIEQLHSACYAPRVIPIKEESSPLKLSFFHAESGKQSLASPPKVESTIALEGKTLWETEGGVKRKLLENVGPGEGSAVFTYYNFVNGALATTPLTASPSLGSKAAETVYLRIALSAEPRSNPTRDASAAATVKDSATLRLTPPQYNTQGAPPCQ
ncbi:MAG: hypothetical protein JST59_08555 [Actinobacteria bacterium]|nr:hypothetical protein [Actinomycetota bacterium]